jgi:hypothetical protein
MKPTKRKLSLQSQTLRHLAADQLGRVYGGLSSARGHFCSTWEDTGCCPTGQPNCATPTCPTEADGCTTVY